MEFSAGLAVKVLGGASAVTVTSVGGVMLHKYLSSHSITKWDQYIIDAIGNDDANTFNFSVGDGASGFPSFSTVDNSQKASISFTITTSTQTAGSKGAALKSKNQVLESGGNVEKDWTWKCTVEFVKDKNVSEGMKEGDKNSVYKTDNTGILGKITQANNGKLKKEIVRLCAEARGSEINKKLDSVDNLKDLGTKITGWNEHTIVSTKTFNLEKGSGTDLVFKKDGSEEDFKLWFSEIEKRLGIAQQTPS